MTASVGQYCVNVYTLNQLSKNYRHPGLQTKPIQGSKSRVYECRVDQSIRLIYDIFDSNIRCWYVGMHDVALKRGQRIHDRMIDDIQPPSIEDLITGYLESCIVPYGFVKTPTSTLL